MYNIIPVMWKHQTQLKDIQQNNLSVLFKSVKVKNEENVKDC